MNGIQREAQWKPSPFDSLPSDFLPATPWLNTQSLTRSCSLRPAPSFPPPSSSGTLPSAFSLHSTPLSALQGLQSSSSSSSCSSSFSTPSPLAMSLLPPPPVPSRSRSQEALRVSPNPFLADPVPARPSSTNPFTGPLVQQRQRRSLTPDFLAQQQANKPGLHRTMSAFTQPLAPTLAPAPAPVLAPALAPALAPTAAPAPQLHRSMSLFGQSSRLTPTAAALPIMHPSSTPAPLMHPPSVGKCPQQWVTFDDDLKKPTPANAPPATVPVIPPSSSLPRPQTQLPCSGFDLDPNWASSASSTFPSLPPPIPARTVPSNPPGVPARAYDSFPFPKEFTER